MSGGLQPLAIKNKDNGDIPLNPIERNAKFEDELNRSSSFEDLVVIVTIVDCIGCIESNSLYEGSIL